MESFIDFLYIIYNEIGYIGIILSIIFLICAIFILYEIDRVPLSPEARKIMKKNGRKAIFWKDKNGNISYKRPRR